MPTTLAFDVYGTLIDTQGIASALGNLIGEKAEGFSKTWREKQLEYSFRRGLMQNYETFAVCTRDALAYCCTLYKVNLSTEQQNALLQAYRSLPAFSDVNEGLQRLKAHNHRLFAFSNGAESAVENLLTNAGIRQLFIDIVSVDDIKSFKPNPAVYSHFLRKSASNGGNAWLVSSNPFDVIGAISAGMRAAWVQRSEDTVFDPWGIEPTITVKSLIELHQRIQ